MGGMTAAEALSQAGHVAEEVLFPAAMNVDSADRIPSAHFDSLASGRAIRTGRAGSAPADLTLIWPRSAAVIEIMAGGCLATTFVWLQHHSTVRALAATPNSLLRERWLEPLCSGAKRAGIALGGARPGPPLLRARAVPGGYVFDGSAPWVTGWDMIDVMHALARDDSGNLVAALLPALVSATLAASRLELVAVNASRTVELAFTGHFVPADLVSGSMPHAQWLARDAAGLRPNGSLVARSRRSLRPATRPAWRDGGSVQRRRRAAQRPNWLRSGPGSTPLRRRHQTGWRCQRPELPLASWRSRPPACWWRQRAVTRSWPASIRSGWRGRRCSCKCSARGPLSRTARSALLTARGAIAGGPDADGTGN